MSIWRRPESQFLLLLITLIAIVARAENGPLHVCGPSPTADSSRSLVFVSTLDGKLSALDIANNGELKWSLDFGEGPMLSSNIHRRELNNDGHWVRLIPSLSGGLYKFDGDNLEAVPISTDQLLRSSFRYSDDLVFSGGKETRSYGVSTLTGQILYQCNISGCTNNTGADSFVEQEVLVVQRFQQTVRAVEARTGLEKWNFSVGQHDLVLIPREHADCSGKASAIARDIELRVIVPEGLVWAVNKSNPRVKLWQHKFDSPVVSIWREDGSNSDGDTDSSLEEVDLFDGSQWTWGSEFSNSPGIYVGMHDRQLYVQENDDLTKMIEHSPHRTNGHVKFPWRPYPAIETAVAITGEQSPRGEENGNDYEVSREIIETPSTTALSVLYNSEYINGNGFYLYTKEHYDRSSQCNSTNPNIIIIDNTSQPSSADYADEDDDTPVQVIIVSLWYWWKEVCMISSITAVILNFMLTNNIKHLINGLTVVRDAVHPPVVVETHVETKQEDRRTLLDVDSVKDFKSRYLTDFDPIDCLGKGGYGVVFEAKNKIDDCNYAIKRIALPNSQDSRDRVMREVKALAKLDHHNIVRYFNAWLECPPAGWQEEHDEKYINNQKLLPSEFASEYSQSATKPNGSVCIDVPQSSQSSLDSAFEAFELNNRSTKDDDSFIVFEASDTDEESAITEEIGTCSRDESTEQTNASGTQASRANEETEDSDVVFRNSESHGVDKKELTKRKASFSLKLNNRSVAKKTPKMFLYIQMQLCQKFSLKEWLKQLSRPRDLPTVVNIFRQIVDAVDYVHFQGLIHRDLKPSNIFFAYDKKIKIGDFGLVTAMTEGLDEEDVHTPNEEAVPGPVRDRVHTARVGTRLYMSPEQMNGQIYNYKVDIYSLGIILFELLIPFVTDMERVTTLLNLRNSQFPDGFAKQHPKAFELLNIMLDDNPSKRPTTRGIKARPPLSDNATTADLAESEDKKWHFELQQLSRHSSATSSSTSSESWEKSFFKAPSLLSTLLVGHDLEYLFNEYLSLSPFLPLRYPAKSNVDGLTIVNI